MSHPLQQKIAIVRARVRRVLAVYGLSWLVAAGLAAVLVLGLLDYLVRFQDPGIRLLSSLIVLVVLGWTCYRRLCLALMGRMRDVDLARRLERRFPAASGNLASAVEFLQQSEDDPTAGSVALRRAVIAGTTAQTEDLDFSAVVKPGPAVRAAMVAGAVALVAVILVLLDPPACGTALARLAHPLGDVPWPKTTHLMLRNPVDRVARGQAFEVEVVDQLEARLPQEVRIHYRFQAADGSITEEVEPMHLVDNAMVARRENVTRPFWYFVRGGDDSAMRPIRVEVLEPPAIDSLSVRLIPPPYTGFPVERADKHLRALVGTRVEITARAGKPLQSAVLCWEGRGEIPARLGEDGYSLAVASDGATPLVVEKSGAYWFKLNDQEGLTGGSETRWEIRAVPDAPPTVTIEQPNANLFVTPAATVPLRVAAKDDLAVAKITLEFTRSDRTGQPDAALPLYAGPDRVAPRAAGFSAAAELGESRPVSYDWKLADLGLRPGTQVDFRAAAADYLPQAGKSDARRLTIITPEELADRLAARQAAILGELARVLEMQRRSRQQVGALEIQLREVQRLNQLDLDHLRGADLNQRQVTQTLTSRSDGVPMHLLGLLADLKNNKIDSPDVERQMQALLAEMDRLAKEHLPIVGRELTSAIKAGQVGLEDRPPARAAHPKAEEKQAVQPDPAMAASLALAGTHQDHVIASLEQMLGQLSRHESYRRFHREIGQLLRDQEDLAGRTSDLARRTLTKELKDLLPQELADLKIAAERELELARRLERAQQEMDQAIGQLRESDPLAAETVSDALGRARQLAISAEMRSAGASLEANRMGQAMEHQKQAIENLREILDILANRRESELSRLVKRLREAEADLAEIARQAEALRKGTEEAGAISDQQQRRRELERLSRDQERLREETARLARRLERLAAEAAARSTSRAAEHMQQAGQCAQQGDAPGACRQAGEALKEVQDAVRQLAQQRRRAEAELAMEQVGRLQEVLRVVRQRQEKVLDQTRSVDQLRQTQGRLSRDQAAGVRDLAREQNLLGAQTAGLAEKLAGAELFHLALSRTAGEMALAAEMLDRRQTDAAAQQAEQNALARLDQLLAALEPEKPAGEAASAGGGEGQGGSPRGNAHSLAELKLLKLMQEEVNRRTRELEASYGRPEKLTDDARGLYAQLSQEQGRLAALLVELTKPAERLEDKPEDLPEEPRDRDSSAESRGVPEKGGKTP